MGMRRIGLPVHSSVPYFWVVCDHCCVWSPITGPPCFISFAQNPVQKLSPQHSSLGDPTFLSSVPEEGHLKAAHREVSWGVFPSKYPEDMVLFLTLGFIEL